MLPAYRPAGGQLEDNEPMKDHLSNELGKVLDQYDEARRVIEERNVKVIHDEAQFIAEFAELRRKVVRPVFEAAGAMLAGRGHAFSIAEEEASAPKPGNQGGRGVEASISLLVAPAGTVALAGDRARALTFTTRHYNRTVAVNSSDSHGSGGGIAGAKGAYALDKIDAQLVEDEVVKYIAGVVRA
jgi:hypothetical protein